MSSKNRRSRWSPRSSPDLAGFDRERPSRRSRLAARLLALVVLAGPLSAVAAHDGSGRAVGAIVLSSERGPEVETTTSERRERRDRRGLDRPGLGLSLGLWDVDDSDDLELGFDWGLRPLVGLLVPHVGVAVTDRETVLLYLGLRRDLALGERWAITPSFAVAAWEQGDGKDLGNTLEFRSGVELSRRLSRGRRLGVGIHHVSNASLGERNPGANSILLRYRPSLRRP